MSSWNYPYCPHQAFNKDLQLRLSSIPYTFIPNPTIDAFSNVNVKSSNPKKANIPTLAYEDYFILQKNLHCDTNFARDYYKQTKNLDGIKYDNNLVEDTKEQMNQRNAYVLAGQATQQYDRYEQEKKSVNDSCRRRAVSTLNMHYQNKKQDKLQSNIQNGEWLKKLYRKLEQIAKHIVQGQGQSAQQKQKMFLLSKSNLTANYLSKIKVKNPKMAFQILEQLRILLLKKKLKFQDQRQEQQKNKSVTMSYTTDVSQNTSQGSMLSQATSMNQSNIYGEEQLVADFCDFEALSKKWGLQNVEDVKKMLRFMLTRKVVSQAQLNKVKKIKQAQRINQSLEKLNPQLAKKLNDKKQADKLKYAEKCKKSINKTAKPITSIKKSEKPILNEANLNKQQKAVVDKLLKGSQFDAIGQKFSRNRNYSHLFLQKQKQLLVQYIVNPQNIRQQVKGSATSTKQKRERLQSTSTCICK